MFFIQPIVYCAAALLSIPSLHGASETANHVVFEQGDALYGRICNGSAEKLCDNAHYQKAEYAGGRCYVLFRWDDRQTWLTVLECDSIGNLQRVHTVRDQRLREATCVMSASLLEDSKLFIDLHVNPRVYITVTLDRKTSQTVILRDNDYLDQSEKTVADLHESPHN